MAPDRPELPESGAHLLGLLDPAVVDEPTQGGPHVVVITFQSVDPARPLNKCFAYLRGSCFETRSKASARQKHLKFRVPIASVHEAVRDLVRQPSCRVLPKRK
jgi:hypothetical protein